MTRPGSTALPGALVISLDFELAWGVRSRLAAGGYEENLRGARVAIPRMLALFEEFGVAATWATVGFLFAESRDELHRYTPAERPSYADPSLAPFDDPLGADEADDPLRYAPSLIERIRRTPRQEVATHTFAHYYCQEPGQTARTFDADLSAALAIAAARGDGPTSIVFPRNQHHAPYDEVLLARGITAYRGNPASWMWRFEGAEESATAAKRLGRLLDMFVNLSGHATVPWRAVLQPNGLCDVRASRLLSPYRPALRRLEPLRVRRLRAGVRAAARRGELYHLWWHPHNFGLHTDENLAALRAVLEEFDRCRARFGMRSLAMRDVAALARGDG